MEDTVVIAEVAIVESAVELLPLLYSDYKYYFEEDDELDLTSASYAIEDNKALIYVLEQFLRNC